MMQDKGDEKKGLILLAKGHSRTQCPFDGEEVWGVNDVGSFPEFKGMHIDRVFTFDPRDDNFIAELKAVAPIWSWRDYADVKYPLKEVINHFKTNYFTNTISYMIALAIYEGFTRIRMYGVDAPYGGIYFMEKSGIEYWIGRAQEHGIEVIACEGSSILRTHDNKLYGEREGDCLIKLYLSERMALMNLLPLKGDHDTIYRSGLLRWIIGLKVRERDEHKVVIGASADGTIAYKCDHEFTADLYFPMWSLTYLRDLLMKLEREGKLPINTITIYEKLQLLSLPEKVKDVRPNARISYILATKNRPQFLDIAFRNIDKIIKPEDELIVIDGNSGKETQDVINKYRRMIDVLVSEDDTGPADALNKGILHASGKYIKHYPDDDVIDSLEEPIRYMDAHPEIDLLICGGTKRFGNQEIKINAPANYGHSFEDVFNYGACGTGFIYRRSSFAQIGLPDSDHRIPDQEYTLRCIDKGVVRFFPGNYYLHIIHPQSTSLFNTVVVKKHQEGLLKRYTSRRFRIKRKIIRFLRQWLGIQA